MLRLKICFFLLCLNYLVYSADGNCDVYGSVLKKGETKAIPGKCSQIICKGASYDDFEVKACPNAYAPKHCTFVAADLTKPYPQCCPHWNC